MIPYIYKPILFKLGNLEIPTWGFIVSFAFLLSVFLILKKARTIEDNFEWFVKFCIYVLAGGLFGGKLFYILSNPGKEFIRYGWNFLGIFLFGIFIVSFLMWRRFKKSGWKNIFKKLGEYGDRYILIIVFGLVVGRLGCVFGDGGHLGKITSFSFGVLVDGVLRHYTAFYYFLSLLFILIILFF